MTGRDLVSASLRLIGAIAPGEAPAASEASDGLSTINRMIDAWSTEDLLIYSIVTDSLTLTGAQSYTMGTSGTFNTARPVEILSAYYRLGSGSNAVDYPLSIRSESEYANIAIKALQAPIPTSLYVGGTYPLETLTLYPVPSSGTLVVDSIKPLTTIATLDTAISMPPGYEEALVYNGALRLSPEYGRTPSDMVFSIANSSKASLKRRNYKPNYLRVDSALTAPGRFNIFKGDNN